MQPDDPNDSSPIERALEGVNAGYVAEMQERWLADPGSVDPEWRALFEPAIAPPAEGVPSQAPTPPASTPAPAEPAPLPEGASPLRGPAARLARNMTAS
ncbi:MAG TPA: hypothetical protein VL687_03700, partial [Methylomirabilota bacterium]|nr:hypothetical protein [Methylomirabilota bacterium]